MVPILGDRGEHLREWVRWSTTGLFLLAGEEMVRLIESDTNTDADRRKLEEDDRQSIEPATAEIRGVRAVYRIEGP